MNEHKMDIKIPKSIHKLSNNTNNCLCTIKINRNGSQLFSLQEYCKNELHKKMVCNVSYNCENCNHKNEEFFINFGNGIQ